MLRVTGICAGNSPGTGEFPTQRASNAENASIRWHHHVTMLFQHDQFTIESMRFMYPNSSCYWYDCRAVKLPWIFPGAPLTFNGALQCQWSDSEGYGRSKQIVSISSPPWFQPVFEYLSCAIFPPFCYRKSTLAPEALRWVVTDRRHFHAVLCSRRPDRDSPGHTLWLECDTRVPDLRMSWSDLATMGW